MTFSESEGRLQLGRLLRNRGLLGLTDYVGNFMVLPFIPGYINRMNVYWKESKLGDNNALDFEVDRNLCYDQVIVGTRNKWIAFFG